MYVSMCMSYLRHDIGQECIGLTSNVEGSKITNCTSGITQFGYQGDTCVVIYNNTIGQVKELWSCQENGEWISTSGMINMDAYICVSSFYVRMYVHLMVIRIPWKQVVYLIIRM